MAMGMDDVVGKILQGMEAQTTRSSQPGSSSCKPQTVSAKNGQREAGDKPASASSAQSHVADSDCQIQNVNKHGGTSAEIVTPVNTELVGPQINKPSTNSNSSTRSKSDKRPSDKHRSSSSASRSGNTDSRSSSRDKSKHGHSSRDRDSGKRKHSDSSRTDSDTKKQLDDIKQQLAVLTNTMAVVTPIISELKAARDQWQEQAQYASDDDDDGAHSVSESDSEETPHKRSKSNDGEDQCIVVDNPHNDSVPAACANSNKDDANILVTMAKAINQTETTGPAINDQLSNVVTQYLEKGMDNDSLNKLLEQSLRPKNCNRLQVVKANPAIFNNVSKEMKQDDVRFQRVQKPLIAGITNLVVLMDKLLTASQQNEAPATADMLTTLSQTVGMLCASSHELDLRRRYAFKPAMKDEYKSLCSDSNPVRGELFGDQLSQSVKDLNETNKVTSKLTKKKAPYTGTSTGRQGAFVPFLGGGFRHRFNKPKFQRPYHKVNSHASNRGRSHFQNKTHQQAARK